VIHCFGTIVLNRSIGRISMRNNGASNTFSMKASSRS
jgi:hypothetical protein